MMDLSWCLNLSFGLKKRAKMLSTCSPYWSTHSQNWESYEVTDDLELEGKIGKIIEDTYMDSVLDDIKELFSNLSDWVVAWKYKRLIS